MEGHEKYEKNQIVYVNLVQHGATNCLYLGELRQHFIFGEPKDWEWFKMFIYPNLTH